MHRRLVVFTLCLVQFVDVLGVTSATTAIPAIVHGLNASDMAAGPIATAYATFSADCWCSAPGLAISTGTGACCCGESSCFRWFRSWARRRPVLANSWQPVRFKEPQPPSRCPLLFVYCFTPRPVRMTAVRPWRSGAPPGLQPVLPVFIVGGILAQEWGWRSVFWVNAPIGVLLIVGLLACVPALPPESRRQPLDIAGACLMIAAVMAIVSGGSLIESAQMRVLGIVLVVTGAASGGLFVLRQRQTAVPLIPIDAFTSRNLRIGTIVSFVNTGTTSPTMVLATLLLQNELGATPVQAGMSLISFSLAVILGSMLSKPLSDRIPPHRLAAIGLATIAAGCASLVITYGTWWGVAAGAAVAGAGIGISSVAGTSIGTKIPDHLAGSASGVLNTGAQLGTAVGVAALLLMAPAIHLGPFQGTALGWAAAAAIALSAAFWVGRAAAR